MKDSVKNKRTLNEIAKRWCKGILAANEPIMSFEHTGLTIPEIDYIEDCCQKIIDRITDKDAAINVDVLVDEYYD